MHQELHHNMILYDAISSMYNGSLGENPKSSWFHRRYWRDAKRRSEFSPKFSMMT